MKNNQTMALITELKRFAIEQKRPLWKRIATDLEKPTRHRRIVNLWKLEKEVKDGETLIVPGKILGDGTLTKKVTLAAASFSQEAKEKLAKSGTKTLTITELMKQHPDGKGVRIIG